MGAMRCSQCGTNWPTDYSRFYPKCPECEGQTAFMGNAEPIDIDEAKSRKNHADFERYLDDNGRRTEVEILERQVAA